METRQQPAPRPQPAKEHPTHRPFDGAQGRPTAEPAKPAVTVRVSVVDDHHDEEEKEAGYGHGV